MGFFCLVCANLARMAKGTKSALPQKTFVFQSYPGRVPPRKSVPTLKDKSIAKAKKADEKLF